MRKTIGFGPDGREGYALGRIQLCRRKGAFIATGQKIIFAAISVSPGGPHRMNDPPCFEAVAATDAGLARRASADAAALL